MKYLDEVRKMNLPEGKYVIYGAGPLAIRGLRENGDVDILADGELWSELAGRYPISVREKDGEKFIEAGHVEVWPESAYFYGLDAGLVIRDCDIIGGLPFAKLEYVVQYKKAMAREKDGKDLRLIREYLAKGGE